MRFIKRFRLFESAERETLNDILLDLSDTGGYSITNKTYFVKEVFPNSRNITTIRHAEIGKEFKWNSISDTILRLIDYLGDDFIFISLSTKEMLKGRIREASRGYSKSDMERLNDISDDLSIDKVMIHYQLSDYDYMVVVDQTLTESEIGKFVDLSEFELTSFDDILEPYKSYSPGHHSNDEDYIKRCDLFGRSVVKYSTSNGFYNSRYGYVWFLRGLDMTEISINKFESGHFLVKSSFGHHDTNIRLFKDIKSVIKYLKSIFQ